MPQSLPFLPILVFPSFLLLPFPPLFLFNLFLFSLFSPVDHTLLQPLQLFSCSLLPTFFLTIRAAFSLSNIYSHLSFLRLTSTWAGTSTRRASGTWRQSSGSATTSCTSSPTRRLTSCASTSGTTRRDHTGRPTGGLFYVSSYSFGRLAWRDLLLWPSPLWRREVCYSCTTVLLFTIFSDNILRYWYDLTLEGFPGSFVFLAPFIFPHPYSLCRFLLIPIGSSSAYRPPLSLILLKPLFPLAFISILVPFHSFHFVFSSDSFLIHVSTSSAFLYPTDFLLSLFLLRAHLLS